MTTKMNEKQLLHKLDIPDWRHMTKDKIITFASSMSQLNPDVAKKALEQFPHFSKMGTEMVSVLRESLDSVCAASSKSMDNAYSINMKILESLDTQLNKRFLLKRDRESIINSMLTVSQNISDLEKSHHQFLSNGLKTIGSVALGLGIVAGAAIGVTIKKP